jgi:hypothetical protein
VGRRKIKTRLGRRWLNGKSVRLAAEVRHIQHRAAEHDGRVVTLGPLVLFSTASGDAWVLDTADHLATPVAQDGDPLPVHIEETDAQFAIGWTGHYRIDGAVFVYNDNESGRVRAILGYPTQQISRQA